MIRNIVRLIVVGMLVACWVWYLRWEQSQNKCVAQKITCINNLKQIGVALRTWALDNQDQFPWNLGTNAGGTKELCIIGSDGFDTNAAIHFEVMSNELNTPVLLVCPQDRSKKVATGFSAVTFQNVTYRLRTGTNVCLANPKAIVLVCPVDGNTLYCDCTVVQGRQMR